MAVIITTSADTPEQITEGLAALGHKVSVEVQGTPPGEQPQPQGVTVTEVTEPTDEKEPEETKTEEKTASDSEPDKEEKKDEVKAEATEKPKVGEEPAEEPDAEAPKNKADRKLLNRIDKVVKQRNELKEAATEKDSRIAELEAELAGRKKEAKEEEPELEKPVRPKMPVASDPEIGFDEEKLTAAREKYETDLNAYEDKKSEYDKAQTVKELTARQKQEREEQERAAVTAAHEKRIASAKERYDDWDDAMDAFEAAGIQILNIVGNTLMESEQGPDILYYLASNLEEAERIGELSRTRPDRALREIGKLEAKFSDGGRKKPRDKDADPETDKKEAKKADEKTSTAKTEETSSDKSTTKERKPTTTLTGSAKSATVNAADIAEKGGSPLEYMRARAAEREARGLRP